MKILLHNNVPALIMGGKKCIIRIRARDKLLRLSLLGSREVFLFFFYYTEQLSGDCQLIGTAEHNNPFAPDERIARRGFFFTGIRTENG